MSKNGNYTLKINNDYLRTTESKFLDREQDPQEGKCNNFNDRKNGGKPTWIVEHHTVSNLERSLKIFTTQGTSAHYMIDKDGTIYHLVADQYRSYHAGIGTLKTGSKLQNVISDEVLKGSNKEGVLGKGSGDMNSWSIGIENVNNGFEPFTSEQTKANIYLHEELINSHKIDAKKLLSHADWAPGRKVDPSPYYDWKALAVASEKYDDIEHNFGVYPSSEIIVKKSSEIVASYKQGDPGNIEQIQRQLEELGYVIIKDDESNLGIFDTKTRDVIYSFTIRYMNTTITNDHEKLALWNLVDYKEQNLNTLARNELSCWTQDHENIIGDILDQY